MLETLLWIIRRDVTLAWRRRTDLFTTLIFFVIVIALFPLGIGPELDTLRLIAPGVMWVGALLASMLALEQLFSADHRDGSLEQLLLTPQPLGVIVLGKVIAHWLITGLPLVVLAPVLGLQYDMSAESLKIMVIALLLGTPTLSLLGAIGAALTLGLRTGGILVAFSSTFIYTRTDFWCRCGRSNCQWFRRTSSFVDAWRHFAGRSTGHPHRDLRSTANFI